MTSCFIHVKTYVALGLLRQTWSEILNLHIFLQISVGNHNIESKTAIHVIQCAKYKYNTYDCIPPLNHTNHTHTHTHTHTHDNVQTQRFKSTCIENLQVVCIVPLDKTKLVNLKLFLICESCLLFGASDHAVRKPSLTPTLSL